MTSMNMHDEHERDERQQRLDRATAARLARLAGRPVDTTALAQRMDAVMRQQCEHDEPAHGSAAVLATWRRWWRPLASAAAAIVIMLAIGWVMFDGGTSPAIAAPAALAQIHYDVANGLAAHLKVSNVDEANKLLVDQASGAVAVPQLPGSMMSCCLHELGNTTLTCALIEQDGRLITVAIADGGMMHSPDGKTIERGGRRYIAHTANGIDMVMTHSNGRWMCVMGEATTEQLLEVATQIRL